MKPAWEKYLDRLGRKECDKILVAAIERLIEADLVRFREADIDVDECLYWVSCGENLLGE